MPRFDGRVVVITGGTGALGSAVVRLIVEQGGQCVVPSHRESAAPPVSGPGTVEMVPGQGKRI